MPQVPYTIMNSMFGQPKGSDPNACDGGTPWSRLAILVRMNYYHNSDPSLPMAKSILAKVSILYDPQQREYV